MRPLHLLAALLLVATAAAAGRAPAPATPLDVNQADAASLEALPGVSSKLAAAVVAYRSEHGPFASLDAVRQVPGMTPQVWERIHARLRVEPPAPQTETAAPAPAPAQGIVALANYFVAFKGIDLDALPAPIRQEFLDTVNREECSCGCSGDTIARCYVNDPACVVAHARLHTLYREALEKAKAPAAKP
jgi:competence ComEA-like helix-hairpin-helix protein